MKKNVFSSLVLSLFFCSCSPSLVYSPSFNLEHKQLEKNQLDLSAGAELLPETRPNAASPSLSTNSSFGYQAQIRYGFQDNLVLGIKSWGDLEGQLGYFRSGYAVSAQYSKSLSNSSRLLFIPRIGMALSDSDISGYGINGNVLYQKMLSSNFSFYTGGGFLWGFYELDQRRNDQNEVRYPMGWAIGGNLGLSYRFNPNLRLNAELNPIYQLNTFDQVDHIIIAPSINLGYSF